MIAGIQVTNENFNEVITELKKNWPTVERVRAQCIATLTQLRDQTVPEHLKRLEGDLVPKSLEASRNELHLINGSYTNLLTQLVNFRDPIPDFDQQLRCLVGEFPEVYVEILLNQNKAVVHVITHPIELPIPNTTRSVQLGRFDICVTCCTNKVAPLTTRAFALEPHFPAREVAENRSNHTHPHARRDGTVCLGEGNTAISTAADTGNLVLTALTFRGVLSTYNPRSPFYRLEEWFNGRCSVCGNSADQEELVKCSKCANVVCASCLPKMTCIICGVVICSAHSGEMTPCKACGKVLCKTHSNAPEHQVCFARANIEAMKTKLQLLTRVASLRSNLSSNTDSTVQQIEDLKKKIAEAETLLEIQPPAEVEQKKKRGRPRKQKATEAPAQVTAAPAQTQPVSQQPITPAAPVSAGFLDD